MFFFSPSLWPSLSPCKRFKRELFRKACWQASSRLSPSCLRGLPHYFLSLSKALPPAEMLKRAQGRADGQSGPALATETQWKNAKSQINEIRGKRQRQPPPPSQHSMHSRLTNPLKRKCCTRAKMKIRAAKQERSLCIRGMKIT